jgi:pectinesterase
MKAYKNMIPKIKYGLWLIVSLVYVSLDAQNLTNFYKDTSFTPYVAFIKEQKKRPYISLAYVQANKKVYVFNNIEYCNTGNRNLLLDIYYPKHIKKQKPVVLLIHGGGWQSGDKEHNKAIATYLANNNFIAISVEYRLSPEAIYPAAVKDLQQAICWIKQHSIQYGIDTTKIATLGCSAGGQLASLIGTNYLNNQDCFSLNSCIKAVINIDGILAFHHPESAEGKVAAQWLGGSYNEMSNNWEEASPLRHVNSFTAPHLFINSSTPRFHAGREDFIKALNTYNIYSQVLELPDTPHTFWLFHPWFNTTLQTVVSFLNKVFYNSK